MDSGLSQAHLVRCESIVKMMLSVFSAPLSSLIVMVGESLVIKQGQPKSHEINNKMIVNSLTARFLDGLFLIPRGDDMKRLLVLLSLLFTSFVYADTITLNFLNEDNTNFETGTCTIGSDLEIPNTNPTKRGYTFDGWLPANITRIEYLESSGTQWIDTGYSPNSSTRALFEINMLYPYTSPSVMGSRTSTTSAAFIVNINSGGDIADYYSGVSPTICIIDNTKKITVDKNRNKTNIYDDNGFQLCEYEHAYQYFQTVPTMCLFAVKAPNKPNSSTHARIHYFKIYDNDVLVRDFIPVLDGEGTPCMYDKVTQQFFYNQGQAGRQFIAGPIIEQ